MSDQKSPFDAEELMQLALRATDRDDVEKAIGFLKQLLELEPENPQATYLLGGLHAQIGLFDRAVEEIGRAVELDPEMPTAHFQLGLLLVRAARFEEAEKAWEPLVALGESHPLFLFRRGILHFSQGEIPECIRDIDAGIALNTDNEPLSRDMSNVKAEAEKRLGKFDEEGAPPGEDSDAVAAARHALLSRYQGENES